MCFGLFNFIVWYEFVFDIFIVWYEIGSEWEQTWWKKAGACCLCEQASRKGQGYWVSLLLGEPMFVLCELWLKGSVNDGTFLIFASKCTFEHFRTRFFLVIVHNFIIYNEQDCKNKSVLPAFNYFHWMMSMVKGFNYLHLIMSMAKRIYLFGLNDLHGAGGVLNGEYKELRKRFANLITTNFYPFDLRSLCE